MLKITGVQKTFNPGTINEKKALCGIDLTLNEGDFCNGDRRQWCLANPRCEYDRRCVPGGLRFHCDRRPGRTKLPEYKRAKFIGRVFQDPMTGTAADMQIARIWPSPLAVARG